MAEQEHAPGRPSSEEPDFGDPDFQTEDPYGDPGLEGMGTGERDELFDKDYPDAARRITEETVEGEDPTGKNLDSRTKRLPKDKA